MTSASVWRDFPEINRSVGFIAGWTSAGLSLGCHCGTITGVMAYLSTPYSAIQGTYPNIRVTVPTKEDPVVQGRKLGSGIYAGHWVPTDEEFEKINKHIRAANLTYGDFAEDIAKAIVQQCSTTPIWVLSDVINYRSPARHSGAALVKENPGIPQFGLVEPMKYIIGKTEQFASYLIKHSIGYIFESPVVQNPSHRSWGNYSLNRVWVWIPPKHLERSLDLSEVYGKNKFPTMEEWKKKVFTDLRDSSTGMTPYTKAGMSPGLSEEDVFKLAFDDGVLPDRHRFEQMTKEA